MGANRKSFLLRAIFFINIICLLFLTSSNLALIVNPAKWWLVALTGLVLPLLLIVVIAFALFWLFADRKKALVCLVFIAASYPNIKNCFAFHPQSSFDNTKKGDIRIVTWNVGLMNYEAPDSATAADANAIIFNELHQLQPDVICLHEFFTAAIPGKPYNFIDTISQNLHYPYHFFSYDYSRFDGSYYSGTILFSRYKITDTAKIIFPGDFGGSVIHAGLLVNKDTVNIFTTRLQSVHFGRKEYKAVSEIKNASANGLTDTRTIIGKLKYGYSQRINQINIIRGLTDKYKTHPIIFTGDMNDVPSSYTYSAIKGDMADAWLDKGFGFGRTFRYIFPTLRIDYIFFNNFFRAAQTRRILTNSSDHNGVVTDLYIQQ